MLQIHPVLNTNDQFFNKLYSLYVSAFPELERRTWEGLVHELTYEKRFHANVLLKENQFVGLLNFWNFEGFYYLEHFAISEKLRGRNIGTDAMKLFMSRCNLPIIFEVEMPTSIIAQKRIQFYERLGFILLPNKYAQPPYSSGEKEFPMQLMTNDREFASTKFEWIKDILYSEVYEFQK